MGAFSYMESEVTGFAPEIFLPLAALGAILVLSRLSRIRQLKELSVTFDGSALIFENYPFEPSTVYPTGKILFADIQDIELRHCSEIRLKNGDILFVPNSSKAALMEFVNIHSPSIVRRTSVWSRLLEPFLDSSQTKEEVEADLQWLAKQGIDKKAVSRWRREVGGAMMAMNFGTGMWEWAGFELFDVLVAKHSFGRRSKFDDFYWRAVALASKDAPFPVTAPALTENLSSALHCVLLDWFPPLEKGGMSTFRERWDKRSGKIEEFSARLFDELSLAYSEPGRMAHVDNCLTSLRNNFERAVKLNEVRWALIFLNVFPNDRGRSAAWALHVMAELGCSLDRQEYVRSLIVGDTSSSPDVTLVRDIDCVRVF
jgi:hypothetical protein